MDQVTGFSLKEISYSTSLLEGNRKSAGDEHAGKIEPAPLYGRVP